MTIANDADRTPSDGGAPTGNGTTSLRDRVRSLRLSGPAPQAPRRSLTAVLLPWGLCVILLVVAVALGVRAAGAGPAKEGPAGPAVTAETASSGDVALEAKGYIIPVHQIQVSPKVSGMLDWIDPRLEEGQPFKAGDRLATIETHPYQDDVNHAKHAYAAAQKRTAKALADLASAKAGLQKSEANRDALLDTYKRDSASPGAVPQQTIVVDKGAYNVADADCTLQQAAVTAADAAVSAAQADEETAQADLEKANWYLANCVITAPVDGTILKKSAEKGNIVNPIAFNISASLCDMADLSDLEVDLKIQERDIAKVHNGQACIAMPEAYENDPDFLKVHPKGYTGVVSRLMPTADRGQGAIPVRVKLDIPKDEEGKYLKPDMGISVEFLKK